MTTILLVRHGRTEWTDERRLQGGTDVPLNEAGRQEVRALQPLVRQWAPRSVVASPAMRAAETAELLSELSAEPDARLLEAGLGEWEGLTPEEIGEDYLGWRAGTVLPPGAEPRETVLARVRSALEDAACCPGPVLLVTHGGVIRAALELLLGLPTGSVVPVGAASMTVLEVLGEPTGAEARAVPGRTLSSANIEARLRHYNVAAATGVHTRGVPA